MNWRILRAFHGLCVLGSLSMIAIEENQGFECTTIMNWRILRDIHGLCVLGSVSMIGRLVSKNIGEF